MRVPMLGMVWYGKRWLPLLLWLQMGDGYSVLVRRWRLCCATRPSCAEVYIS